MTLDIVVAFFVLGAVGRLLKADLVFPAGLHQSLTVFLMLAIGLKGGEALAQHGSAELLLQGVLYPGVSTLLRPLYKKTI